MEIGERFALHADRYGTANVTRSDRQCVGGGSALMRVCVYKPPPEVYLRTARFLAVEPREILMVACHNFDLDAARGAGYRTASLRRPDE